MLKSLQWLYNLVSLIFIGNILLYATPIHAQTVSDLYQATIPVSSNTVAERDIAIKQALTAVLLKVSGEPTVIKNVALQAQLKNPAVLVEQYTYQSVANTNGGVSANLFLKVNFNANKVKQLILKNGFSIWGVNRPTVLIWLTTKDQTGEHFLTAETQAAAITVMQEQAQQRGLPIILPLLDMVDLNTLSLNDINEVNKVALNAALKRYGADATAILQLQQSTTQSFEGVWTLIVQNEVQSWPVQAEQIEQILQQGIDSISNILAKRYGTHAQNTEEAPVILKITQVGSAAAYQQSLAYLKSLAAVKNVQVIKLDENAVFFQIDLLGSRQNFLEGLSLNKQWIPLQSEDMVPHFGEEESRSPGALPVPIINHNLYQEGPAVPAHPSAQTVDYVYQWAG